MTFDPAFMSREYIYFTDTATCHVSVCVLDVKTHTTGDVTCAAAEKKTCVGVRW